MQKIEIIKSKLIPVSSIEQNKGQVDGLPKNPRLIKDAKFEKLKKSIGDNPEMLGARELIVYPYNDKFVIIGGNMRFTACKELGYKELPCKVLPADYSAEQLRAITIKDNVAFGENDWENLANEWDIVELDDWGLQLPLSFNQSIDDDAYEPNLIPETSYSDITKAEIQKEAERLANKMLENSSQKLTDIMCPHCLKEFSIKI